MPTLSRRISAPSSPQIECGSCQKRLPLRMTTDSEPAAVWLCAQCNIPYIACCVKEALLEHSHQIRLDERYFNVAGEPEINLTERQIAVQLSSRSLSPDLLEKRRSERVAQSLVVPAVRLGNGFVPVGEPFQVTVANLSREGVGFLHDARVDSDHIAIQFPPQSQSPIQVIVRLVRQRELTLPFYEIGGEFLVRLGSIAVG